MRIRGRNYLNFLPYLHFVPALRPRRLLFNSTYSCHYFGFGKLNQLPVRANNFLVAIVTHNAKTKKALPASRRQNQHRKMVLQEKKLY